MKKMNKKGFTLAELLIVVAIIAVLVAIAVPVFSAQLDKSKLATATANARSKYAEYVTNCMADTVTANVTDMGTSMGDIESKGCTVTVGESAITITSPKQNSQSFKVDLSTGS